MTRTARSPQIPDPIASLVDERLTGARCACRTAGLEQERPLGVWAGRVDAPKGAEDTDKGATPENDAPLYSSAPLQVRQGAHESADPQGSKGAREQGSTREAPEHLCKYCNQPCGPNISAHVECVMTDIEPKDSAA